MLASSSNSTSPLDPLREVELGIRTDRSDSPFLLAVVKASLNKPTESPRMIKTLKKSLSRADSLSGLLALSARLLDSKPAGRSTVKIPRLPPEHGLPPPAQTAVETLLASIARSQGLLDNAIGSLAGADRDRAAAAARAHIFDETLGGEDASVIPKAAPFDVSSLLAGASLLSRAAESALPDLWRATGDMRSFPRTRWKFPFGDVLVSGAGEDSYSAEDLKGVALLIDFGGDNRYSGAPAAAGPGEIRLVIDLSENVSVENRETPGCGSGAAGIGLMYLPNPRGAKTLLCGDISLGAGLFGVGGLFAEGAARLEGGRLTQGAGVFGAGICLTRGRETQITAKLAGQGFGFTKGIGILRHAGDRAQLTGGLSVPDPRENLALLSLSQGVGLGPRSYAAGGIGLVFLAGNDSALNASYMAQGSGYWLSLGGLFLTGDRNRLQARRYSQGAGVHAAAGFLDMAGHKNSLVNWGVGPAFGWDFGIGWLVSSGDENSFSTEWGSGRGDANGHGLASIKGNRNRLALADLGSGAFRRGRPSYGLVSVSGKENRYKTPPGAQGRGEFSLSVNPWGRILAHGDLILDPQLSHAKTEWPTVDREGPMLQKRESLFKILSHAQTLPPRERLKSLLSVLSGAGLDGQTQGLAASQLLSLSSQDGAELARLIDPDRFDDLLWLRLAIPSYGTTTQAALLKEWENASGIKKASLLGFFAHLPVSLALQPALSSLGDKDWRLRRTGAAILGGLFNREEGEEPGRLRLLEAALSLCRGGSMDEALKTAGGKRLNDLYALLAMAPELPAQARLGLLQKCPTPFDLLGPSAQSTREALQLVSDNRAIYSPLLDKELTDARRDEDKARDALVLLLKDPEWEVVHAALLGLAQMGREEDAERVASFLRHPQSLLRDGAAAGLGKMGLAAFKALDKALASPRARERSLAALAVSQTSRAEILALLPRAFADRDPAVRLAAVTGLFAFQNVHAERRNDFYKTLQSMAEKDPSPSVRASAGLVAAQIGIP